MTRSLRWSSALALVIASAAILSGCVDGGGGYAYDGGVGVDYYQPYGGYYGGWGGGYYVGPVVRRRPCRMAAAVGMVGGVAKF